MKKTLFLTLLLSTQIVFASPLVGSYKVTKACRSNNIRLSVLNMMYSSGSEVKIDLDLLNKVIIFSSYHADSVVMPLVPETKLSPMFFEDYYTNSEINLRDNLYSFKTKGSELQKCSNEPFPGNHVCLKKWNDEVIFTNNLANELDVTWKVGEATGSCSLERI